MTENDQPPFGRKPVLSAVPPPPVRTMTRNMYERRRIAVHGLISLLQAQENTHNAVALHDGDPRWKDVTDLGAVMATLGKALVELGMSPEQVEREFRLMHADHHG